MVGTGEEPKVLPTKRYSVSDVCSILGIHRNTLRSKTKEGLIKCQYRTEGKRAHPLYLGKDIVKYWRGM